MPLYKTKGIVLKNWPLSEADKIVVIYTPAYGKISGVAKGVRKTKSKFGSSMEIFTYGQFILYGKQQQNLDTITQSEIICSFRQIREDLTKIVYGSFIVELMNVLVSGREKDVAIFSLLLSTLTWLQEESTELIIFAFSLKLLALLGLEPQLENCVLCRQIVNNQLKFSPHQGGVLCKSCGTKEGIFVSPGVVGVMKQILKLNIGKIRKIQIAPNILSQMREVIIDSYLNYHLPSELKSVNLWKNESVANSCQI